MILVWSTRQYYSEHLAVKRGCQLATNEQMQQQSAPKKIQPGCSWPSMTKCMVLQTDHHVSQHCFDFRAAIERRECRPNLSSIKTALAKARLHRLLPPANSDPTVPQESCSVCELALKATRMH